MDNVVIVHNFLGSAFAQVFSVVVHVVGVFIGATLVRGYYIVFKGHPSNVAFAMVMLLSSMVTTSIILGTSSFVWFFRVCLFCELNEHLAWLQMLWTGFYGVGFIILYLILKKKISL